MRDRAVGNVMDDDAGGLPITIDYIDDGQLQSLAVERDALGTLFEQHRLTVGKP